ncbi:hypothetical protein VE03_10436, partial [Pseudogymnoascus sp. 23342-1-I1]
MPASIDKRLLGAVSEMIVFAIDRRAEVWLAFDHLLGGPAPGQGGVGAYGRWSPPDRPQPSSSSGSPTPPPVADTATLTRSPAPLLPTSRLTAAVSCPLQGLLSYSSAPGRAWFHASHMPSSPCVISSKLASNPSGSPLKSSGVASIK